MRPGSTPNPAPYPPPGIFECLGRGLTTRKIAEQFGLSARTVEVHRARIKKKLQCEDAAQLLREAVKWVETRDS